MKTRRRSWLGVVVALAIMMGVGTVAAQDKCDADSDGVRSVACGGNDCDDNDVSRYPGAAERCDGTVSGGRSAANHDEDCNPCTVASSMGYDGDHDHDLMPAFSCSNPWNTTGPLAGVPNCDPRLVRLDPSTRRTYGIDCDDTKRIILPGSQVCVPGDPSLVRICLETGVSGSGKQMSDWDTRKCTAGTHCVPQPNGAGVCVD